MQKDIKTASEYMTVGETAKKMGTNYGKDAAVL